MTGTANNQNAQYKVLLLDDERLVRFTISSYLKSAGYTVVATATPDEAIGYIKREAFHAVISDVVMGEVDGFMFRDLVRQFDVDIPILFLTSMLSDGGNTFLERLMSDLHTYYVSKSAPRAVLLGKLEQIIGAHVAAVNVRVMESRLSKSLSLASLVQKAMLPTWTHISPEYAYATCWEPLNEVSGDLFEWYPVAENAALFIIGDLSGHGANAALAMTAIQAFLKQYGYIEDKKARQIHKIAQQVHNFLKDNLGDIAYMAMTVIYLNASERIVRYLNCGNPEPLCIDTKTSNILLHNPENRGAIPPGLVADATYNEEDIVEFNYNDDDIFIVYSDGICDISQDEEGTKSPTQEEIQEICTIASTKYPGETQVICDLPYRVVQSLYSMGYTQKQDDMSFFVFGKFGLPESDFAREVRMTPKSIDELSQTAHAWVLEKTGNNDLSTKIDLLLSEHLMNVYRHGLSDFGRQHEVSIVTMTLTQKRLVITTWDRGIPWKELIQYSEHDAEDKLNQQNAVLAGGGRGAPILQKISESISSDRYMNLNRTVFHVRVPEQSPENA